MDVLVIGGTHFLGPWVVKGLHEKGHTVTLFHRGQTEVALPPEIAHLHGDRKDLLRFGEHFKEHPQMAGQTRDGLLFGGNGKANPCLAMRSCT
jgi:nucleoside-diphosphate-sugar epimerase